MDLGIKESYAHMLADDRKWKEWDKPTYQAGTTYGGGRIIPSTKKPVSEMTEDDILKVVGMQEPDSPTPTESWVAKDIYARINGLDEIKDEIKVPIDLGLCNHEGILTTSLKIYYDPVTHTYHPPDIPYVPR